MEPGSASIVITLEDGSITITHGTAGVPLASIINARKGTWDALWAFLESQDGYQDSTERLVQIQQERRGS